MVHNTKRWVSGSERLKKQPKVHVRQCGCSNGSHASGRISPSPGTELDNLCPSLTWAKQTRYGWHSNRMCTCRTILWHHIEKLHETRMAMHRMTLSIAIAICTWCYEFANDLDSKIFPSSIIISLFPRLQFLITCSTQKKNKQTIAMQGKAWEWNYCLNASPFI